VGITIDALLFGIDLRKLDAERRYVPVKGKVVILPIRAFHRGREKPDVFSAKRAETMRPENCS
jgi:hypothetical protein